MCAALDEARKAAGRTSPNPAVGAVIVKGRRILARGFHRAAGRPHAEIEAIRALPQPGDAAGATLYVTLEPCSTHGRTPPCTDEIVRLGFARVVYGATDPNPAHSGRAEIILRSAGIEVKPGMLGKECAELNAAWNHWIATGRPYVIAKCGMSLDGRISSHPESRWITSPESRVDAMRLRAGVDAILVGGGTVRADNPKLTVRGIAGARQPWRVVVTRSGRLPATSHLLTDRYRDRTLVFQDQSLADVLIALGGLKITSVLIEGGGRILGEAFDHRLVDEAVIYVAPQLIGGPVAAVGGIGVACNEDGLQLRNARYDRIGDDVCIRGSLRD
ncbi:MAG: bifunctional diaminohydroxyphosphoribosylaminopyrimidine deaminase/5-amino-6-(5-phosphoribosylamino)uracil reductase RibD [Terrimicrobiaceae bacterium]|nr:bifunctional diaminohydroxyphosphoribosylaminopyrimidine deaminase/5-amino-6-(5-phosphoribosylamino)uracil reductase RibD [Terrimicrobiaceae bacterium]